MMKKWIVSVMLVMCAAVFAGAQNAARYANDGYGIETGNFVLSFQGGAVVPVSQDMRNMSKTGYTVGVQLLGSATDSLAIGLEVSGTHHDGKVLYSGLYDYDKLKLTQYNPMLAMRMYANPADRVRFYNSIGVGASFVRIEDKTESGKEKENCTAFAFYGGLGFEAELAPNLILGVEGRLNYTNMKKYNFDPVTISGIARLGFKF